MSETRHIYPHMLQASTGSRLPSPDSASAKLCIRRLSIAGATRAYHFCFWPRLWNRGRLDSFESECDYFNKSVIESHESNFGKIIKQDLSMLFGVQGEIS